PIIGIKWDEKCPIIGIIGRNSAPSLVRGFPFGGRLSHLWVQWGNSVPSLVSGGRICPILVSEGEIVPILVSFGGMSPSWVQGGAIRPIIVSVGENMSRQWEELYSLGEWGGGFGIVPTLGGQWEEKCPILGQ
ncbi:unnamed protein product, partial [Staurois parvus]